MRSILPALIFAIACSAAPAIAQDKADAQADKSETKPKEKMVCHREPVTGSFMRKRKICLTESDWAKVQEERDRATDQSMDSSRRGWRNDS